MCTSCEAIQFVHTQGQCAYRQKVFEYRVTCRCVRLLPCCPVGYCSSTILHYPLVFVHRNYLFGIGVVSTAVLLLFTLVKTFVFYWLVVFALYFVFFFFVLTSVVSVMVLLTDVLFRCSALAIIAGSHYLVVLIFAVTFGFEI